MSERAELLQRLAEVETRLAALPRADQVRHAHSVIARRTAYEVRIQALRARIEALPEPAKP